jgi:medium-chain acyl-[acyl-carrier-protein] hydrolase
MHMQADGKASGARQAPATPWLVKPKVDADASLRLFCFPYAGGGAVIYRSWSARLPMAEVLPVQLPGRETRLKEAPYTNLLSLVRATGRALLPYLDRPFCFFGHSMGALLAFELARELRREYALSPARIFLSGRRAPGIPRQHKGIHSLPRNEFIERLRGLNGTLPAVLEHTELIELLLPRLRADFAVCETYRYTPEAPLDCGIAAFGGLDDRHVRREHLEGWREQTTGEFKLRMLPGDHFFLHSAQEVLLDIMFRELHRIGSKQIGSSTFAPASKIEA